MSGKQDKIKTIIDFILVITIPIISFFYLSGAKSEKNIILAIIIISVCCVIVIISHSNEIMAMKKYIAIMYFIMTTIGLTIAIFALRDFYFIAYIIISSLGIVTLFIPGTIRYLLYISGKLRKKILKIFKKTDQVGKIEALSLFYLRTPWQFQEIRNTMKYSFFNKPWKSKVIALLSGQFVINALYKILLLSNMVNEVKTNRCYNINNIKIKICLNNIERIIFTFTIGILIYLKKVGI
jgi:hypothetical protein